MNEQPGLFDIPPEPPDQPDPGKPQALSVGEFNQRVSSFLKGMFPGKLRIQGFVSGFNRSYRRGSHIYFDLMEKDPGDESRPLSKISMVIWRGTRSRLRRQLEALGGPEVELDDLQVYFEVSVNYYVPGGRLSLVVEGVDLEASLGAAKLDRDRILRLLASEGLLEKNRAVPLPAVPLRLGLITSVESAAYHDFIKELDLAGIAFTLSCIDARVQGPDQRGDMDAAFTRLEGRVRSLDAVILIRGGGSRSDLAGFDAEELARRIAGCPLPVLTGIGHEIDRSVADEVTHQAFKTPTAVAQFLVQRVENWLLKMDDTALDIRRAGERHLLRERGRLDRSIHTLHTRSLTSMSISGRRLGSLAARLPGSARGRLRLAGLEMDHRQRGISPARLRGTVARERVRLNDIGRQIERGGGFHLSRAGERLSFMSGRLGSVARRNIERTLDNLARQEERVRLTDPAGILKRGFSITRDSQGRPILSAARVKVDDRIRTTFADGQVFSRVSRDEDEQDD
jgi:exodeoxyribonuclease VII large subunit